MTTPDDFFADLFAMLDKLPVSAEGGVNLDDLPEGEIAAFVERHKPDRWTDDPPDATTVLAAAAVAVRR